MHQAMAKLATQRHGPFKVLEVLSPVNYRLKLPPQWSIHPVFHTNLLTPYCKTATHGINYKCPPLDLVEGEAEYKIEKITDKQHFSKGQRLQYLVKWKGYPDSDNQWVNKRDMHADEAIREYEASKIKGTQMLGEHPSHSA